MSLSKELSDFSSSERWKSLWGKRYASTLFLLLGVVLFCGTAWLVSLAPTDIAHYECYSLAFWRGSEGLTLLPPTRCSFLSSLPTPFPAFHLLPQEYPPLTILVFSLPLIAPLPYYGLVFALLMTLGVGGVYRLLTRFGGAGAGVIFLFYLILGTGAVVQERFDLLPATCTLICLLAAERGRWTLAYSALALGVLLKFYPLILLPSLFLAEQRFYQKQPGFSTGQTMRGFFHSTKKLLWRSQNILLFALILIGVSGGFALINYTDALLSPLSYFLNRPIQVESLAGSLLWLGKFLDIPYHLSFKFGSLNIDSELTSAIALFCNLLSGIGILAVLWLQWRRRIGLSVAMVGLICVLLVTGKVFSPQYLIWLFPLLAYIFAQGKASRLEMYGWVLISFLTTCIYIVYYSQLAEPASAAQKLQTLSGFFEGVTMRNLLLFATVLLFLRRNWQNKEKEDKRTKSFAGNATNRSRLA